jgi:flagellar biosynthesis protein FlhF
VLSTTANARNVQAAMERFAPLGVYRVILTKLDEAVSFGMILNVVRQMNTALSYVTTGQDVPDDLEVSQGRRIADLIVKGGAGCCWKTKPAS